MTTEENSIIIIQNTELLTKIIESMKEVVAAEGRIGKVLNDATTTILDLTERVIHLERMIGIRK